MSVSEPLRVGVLAIQGDFAAHIATLRSLGAEASEVRVPADLDGLDGLVIPGGESTAISLGIAAAGLEPAIRAHHARGRPLLGTCAGLIVCDSDHLALIDAKARRNAFGRQLASFETDLVIDGIGSEPLRAVFIRAPWVESWSDDVDVLASVDDHPVVIRQGRVLACAFHPELTDDQRLHALFMAMISTARAEDASDREGREARR
jgi:5'-phosphate synthase pdxT subunit